MVKKIFLLVGIMIFLSISAHAVEFGLNLGAMSNSGSSSGLNYGISGGGGFFIPMVKFEFEYYKVKDTEPPNNPSAMTVGIKFRPKFGKFSPYAIIGVGSEFDKLNFSFSKYERFTFLGGGVHFFLMDIMSLRADIRFLNFSDRTKTRFSGGLYIHI
jgi:opacity protein-like surface antigen